MKRLVMAVCSASAAAMFAVGTPSVTGVSLSCDAETKTVRVDYTLADAPGVVTFDIQTNVTGDTWASVGGKLLAGAWGDVNAYVEGVGETHSIFWRPQVSCPGLEIGSTEFRAVVTAWPEEAPPDYMVIDLNSSTNPAASLLAGHCFYPEADQIPGGIQSREYKIEKLVMRRIPVVPTMKWVMGQSGLRNTPPHYVTLTNSFYMGVYEITFAQWENICRSLPSATTWQTFYTNFTDVAVLPVNGIDFTEVRGGSEGGKWSSDVDPTVGRAVDATYNSRATLIAGLRKRTGVLFDLPTEAQWEYACRAGTATAFNSGEDESDAACGALAWYSGNSFLESIYAGSIRAVHPVGSKGVPNAWGLYDMHGNVREMCLDISVTNLGSEDATEPIGGLKPTSGSVYRIVRGGYYGDISGNCQSAYRTYTNVNAHYNYNGVRVVCPYPLDLKW